MNAREIKYTVLGMIVGIPVWIIFIFLTIVLR